MLPKSLITCSLLLLAICAVSEDTKMSLHPAPKIGDKFKASYEMSLKLSGTQVTVNANYVSNVSAVEDGKVTSDVTLNDLKVLINDQDENVPSEPYVVQIGANGDILKLSGGITGSDYGRTYLLTHFPMPAQELELNKPITFTLPQVKSAGIPERKIVEIYRGKDIVDGKAAHKVSVKLEEVKGDELTEDATYWLNDNGTIAKVVGTFTNLPIPQAEGLKAEGEVKFIAQ